MKNFAIIVAVDQQNGIGKNNTLPWHLPGELKRFSKLTKETQISNKKNAVIMGRNTWDSLPSKFKPLPGRINVVLSRNTELALPQGVLRAASLDQALDSLEKTTDLANVFVIGGAAVYEMAVLHPACTLIYFTQIEAKFDCDTFFPALDLKVFHKLSVSEIHSENGLNYRYLIYAKFTKNI